jgi:hypothetical protein
MIVLATNSPTSPQRQQGRPLLALRAGNVFPEEPHGD